MTEWLHGIASVGSVLFVVGLVFAFGYSEGHKRGRDNLDISVLREILMDLKSSLRRVTHSPSRHNPKIG